MSETSGERNAAKKTPVGTNSPHRMRSTRATHDVSNTPVPLSTNNTHAHTTHLVSKLVVRLAAAEDAGFLARRRRGSRCSGGGLSGGLGARHQLELGALGAGRRLAARRHVWAASADGAILACPATPVLPAMGITIAHGRVSRCLALSAGSMLGDRTHKNRRKCLRAATLLGAIVVCCVKGKIGVGLS